MAKKAVWYEDAERMAVDEGLSLPAICEVLDGKVSRRTLYHWAEQGNWAGKRKKKLDSHAELTDELEAIARLAITEYKTNPTPGRMFAAVKAISTLKQLEVQAAQTPDEDEDTAKQITGDLIAQIQKEILGV
jgi:hypothetical protein